MDRRAPMFPFFGSPVAIRRRFERFFFLLLLLCLALLIPSAISQQAVPSRELSRTVRTWEFLPVVGTRAGLFGTESGRLKLGYIR
jgi:hypothetical protein